MALSRLGTAALAGLVLPVAFEAIAAVATRKLPRATAFASRPALAAPRDPTPGARLPSGLPPEAKADYESGKLLYLDRDFATALMKFEAAHAATKDARLLWNIAVCLKNLRRYARAIDALRAYAESRDPRISAGDLRDAAGLMTALAPFTTELTLAVSEAGADVFVDDARIGVSPLATPLAVDLGNRHIVVQKAGFLIFDKDVSLAGRKTVDVKLEPEGGRLELRTVAGATIAIDGVEVGLGPTLSRVLPRGGHLLRISALGRRTYQGDIVIDDGKTRSLDVSLDEANVALAELRVAVGCAQVESASPETGLTIFLDHAPESAAPGGARKRLVRNEQVTAYVPYPIAPGVHAVRVHLPNCKPLEITTTASLDKPTLIAGTLPPSSYVFRGSPVGSPNGWRLAAGVAIMSETLIHRTPAPPRYVDGTYIQDGSFVRGAPRDLSFGGPSISGGWRTRWLSVMGEVSMLFGAVTGPAGESRSVRHFNSGGRFGFHVPLYYVAPGVGFGIDVRQYSLAPDDAPKVTGSRFTLPLWVSLDVKPFCAWGLGTRAEYASVQYESFDPSSTTILYAHVIYEPNELCTWKNSGKFKLEQSR